jgi:hypothetical protein
MKSIEWLEERLGEVYIPYPEEAFVEWWIKNDKLPKVGKGPSSHRKWSKDNPYKTCPSCKVLLHITKYNIRKARSERHGHLCIAAFCMDCCKIKSRTGGKPKGFFFGGAPTLYHGKTPIGPKTKVYQGTASQRGRDAKQAVMEYFGRECMRCGFEGLPQQMDVDHLNPKEKKISLSTSTLAHSSPEDIIKEIVKCQMVCANCHRLISTKAKHQKERHTYFTVGEETFTGHPKGILERMSAPEPDREHLRRDS